MRKLIAAMLLLITSACTKDSISTDGVVPPKPVVTGTPVTLGNATLLVNGSLDLQTSGVNIASLGIINYRSSYEVCGTAGSNLLWPVTLPLADSAVYSSSILADGDSLSAEVVVDTTYKKSFDITMIINENEGMVDNQTVYNQTALRRKFQFHNGSSYQIFATVSHK